MSSNPTNTPVTDWAYVSEGGATMVFSYSGPSHPAFTRKVLRVRKSLLGQATPDLNDGEEEPDDPSIEFQNRVTSRLVDPKYLPSLDSVHVTKDWLKELSNWADKRRPEARRSKDDIDIGKKKAVLATDLVGGKGWAVEIKPKWGFLPNSSYLSDDTKEIKIRNCRFCMHSLHKTSAGESAATRYCPLHLYSSDPSRIEHAIHSLWRSWIESDGHINNLKVFVEGGTIRPSEALERLTPILGVEASSIDQLLPPFTQTLLQVITKESLLPDIANLQRTLDSLDVEGLAYFWSRLHRDTPLGEGIADPTMDEWVSFTSEYLAEVQSGIVTKYDAEFIDDKRLRYHMLAYLLSATFKDCSVILRWDGEGEGKITVIDLDPKKIERLKKWQAQDKEIVLHFKEVSVPKEPCVDPKKPGSV